MRITKICVQNFRLLKDLSIDLEDDLSIILGKNNCGKTSLMLILDRFLGNNTGKSSFTFDDFNTDFKEDLKYRIENPSRNSGEFPFSGISLKLFIEYDEQDDLSNIGNKVIMDLDLKNKVVVLAFEYYISEDHFSALKRDFQEQKAKKEDKAKDLFAFLKDQYASYFQISKKSVLFDLVKQKENDEVFTDLIKENIRIDRIISFKWINAKRNVSNKDSDRALSSLSSKIYKKMEASKSNPNIVEKFKDTLSDTDKQLDDVYEEIFQEVIHDVKKFGGMQQDDSVIKIVSSLQHKELLEENTTVMYDLNTQGHSLPENYNGLGYMNLISMIFEIKILLHEFQREKEEKPSDINLLFIEEPEVHTHPQMQCVFIKNIKSLLKNGIVRKDRETRSLQTILSTHSSHIVSESDFEDIKYFKRENDGIISKNLKDLKKEYEGYKQNYKFLKQYLTLHRSDLFFADKAIFIEGDTERMLLPAIMKKLDQEDFANEFIAGEPHLLPLLSQNISIIEVGAYSQIFEKFIDFIGTKSLIITDIDSVKIVPDTDDTGAIKKNADGTDKTKIQKCQISEDSQTSNTSLKFFYGKEKTLSDFISLTQEQRVLKKDPTSKKWVHDTSGRLLCVYQTKETVNGVDYYHARSFEEAFFFINEPFISQHTFDSQDVFIGNKKFPSLTQTRMKKFAKSEINAWEMAKGVGSKPSFAMEILLNSEQETIELQKTNTDEKTKIIKDFTNWNIPSYIKEGLQWLKRD